MLKDLEALIIATNGVNEFSSLDLANQRRYRTYLKIPAYVSKYLDKFGVAHDADKLIKIVGLFYVWLKTVDDEIDDMNLDGYKILERFNTPQVFEYGSSSNLAVILTDSLREITWQQHEALYVNLKKLYETVQEEKAARNISELIEARKQVGRETALTTLEIISPYVSRMNSDFERFFLDLGEAAIIYDTWLDFGKDVQSGILNFKPTFIEYALLSTETIRQSASILIKYPFLFSDCLKHLPTQSRRQ